VEAGKLAASVDVRPRAETLAAEILPLLECCRFLERRAAAVLRSSRSRWRQPLWLRGTVVETAREPFGTVLIVGPSNYGLMLAAVQALHALAAGNAVIIKPAPGSSEVLERFAALLEASGLPHGTLTITDASPQFAHRLLAAGVDKLVFTGSSATGRQLLAAAAENLVPATLELSGWDACIVLDDADITRVAAALTFALTLNAGRTCLAPRRVIASPKVCHALERLVVAAAGIRRIAFDPRSAALVPALVEDAQRRGARLLSGDVHGATAIAGPLVLADVTPHMGIFSSDLFGSVLLLCAADDVEDAIGYANQAPFALGVTIFGAERKARALVPRLVAGVAMINDVIVPAAHPEVSLAPRRASGFGVTRGAEGLLEMTRPKVTTLSRARWPLHLQPQQQNADLLAAYALAAYGDGFRERLRALARAFGCIGRAYARRSER
jgi:acyl-CoA reductase-like NAD-dependent aldehyde dehydrogenase